MNFRVTRVEMWWEAHVLDHWMQRHIILNVFTDQLDRLQEDRTMNSV